MSETNIKPNKTRKEQIVEMIEAGRTVREIADILGMSMGAIHDRLNHWKIGACEEKPWPSQMVVIMTKLITSGQSTSEVAKILGEPESRVIKEANQRHLLKEGNVWTPEQDELLTQIYESANQINTAIRKAKRILDKTESQITRRISTLNLHTAEEKRIEQFRRLYGENHLSDADSATRSRARQIAEELDQFGGFIYRFTYSGKVNVRWNYLSSMSTTNTDNMYFRRIGTGREERVELTAKGYEYLLNKQKPPLATIVYDEDSDE